MIRTLAWKEWREQRSIWLAVAGAGAVLLVGRRQVLEPLGIGAGPAMQESIGAGASGLAFIYGLVCGATLLAGERESQTLPFLDALEAQRARLWNTKVLTGIILTLAQALLLAGIATGLGSHPKEDIPGGWLGTAMAAGLAGLAWSLLGSALSRSALAAVGLTAVLLVLTLYGLLVVVPNIPDVGAFIVLAIFIAAPLAASRGIFCRLDGLRRNDMSGSALRISTPGPARRIVTDDLRAALWLTYRQTRGESLLLAAAGLALGFLLPGNFLILWPAATLVLGAVCGAAVLRDEQGGDTYRFLGDQRLPVGRIWAVKSLGWLAIAVLAAALALWWARIYFVYRDLTRGSSVDGLVGQLAGLDLTAIVGPWMLLTLGLAYGFATGQFFALLTSKNAVAVVLAILVGAAMVAAWTPSLLAAGIAWWQVLAVPGLLLAATRLVLWAWASGCLQTVRPVLILGSAGVLAWTWIGANLWYRAFAIPEVGEPFDVRAFAATLLPPEQNEAGRLIRKAAAELPTYLNQVSTELGPPTRPLFPEDLQPLDPGMAAAPAVGAPPVLGAPGAAGPGDAPPDAPAPPPAGAPGSAWTYIDRLPDVLARGWPKDAPELGRWLDRMFEGEWAGHLREAARLPLGTIMDLKSASFNSALEYVGSYREAANLFVVRALQLQARGDSKAALEHLGVVLALSRNLRHKVPSLPYLVGVQTQTVALTGMARWLEEPGPRAELLRAALNELNQHEARLPPFADYFKVDYLLLQNERESLASFLPLGRAGRAPLDQGLLVLAGKVPWEEQREIRMLHALAARALRLVESPPWGTRAGIELPAGAGALDGRGMLPFNLERAYSFFLYPVAIESMRCAEAASLCQLRGTRQQVALALYEVEKRRAATRLDALVPDYLPAVPLDPYSGQSFHYRISRGEAMERAGGTERVMVQKVWQGRGVVWSVGLDRIDNGGLRDGGGIALEHLLKDASFGLQVNVGQSSLLGQDWIFLVPRWATVK
jgi:hypothetical protein